MWLISRLLIMSVCLLYANLSYSQTSVSEVLQSTHEGNLAREVNLSEEDRLLNILSDSTIDFPERFRAAHELQNIEELSSDIVHTLMQILTQEASWDLKSAITDTIISVAPGKPGSVTHIVNAIEKAKDDDEKYFLVSAINEISKSHRYLFDREVSNKLFSFFDLESSSIQSRQEVRIVINLLQTVNTLMDPFIVQDWSYGDYDNNLTKMIYLIGASENLIEDNNKGDAGRYRDLQSYAVENIVIKLGYLRNSRGDNFGDIRARIDLASRSLNELESFPDIVLPSGVETKKTIDGILVSFHHAQQIFILSYIRSWAIGNRAYWIMHPLFWLALIFAYPYSPQVQATFFWNKHVRDILGLWYVGMILRSIPPLRQRLFAPFRESLLADAKLDVFATHPYFPDSEIQLKGSQQRQPLTTAIPAIKGQIILEGESGLGKTMLLRHLVNRSKRLTVYLPAYKCEAGVIEAIQAKLHGQAQDADFLRHLIYSGALDICIDGLNEVRAEVRANITSFVESYFKGNIVMTTQPLVWNPPATAKTYVIQPLRRDQVQQFLALVEPSCADAPENSEAYSKNCAYFLEQALSPDQPPEDSAIARRILSNPMDLSIVAQILAKGIIPELFQLQQQQYWLMAQDYEQAWNQKFPLQKFSESVYQMRLNDTYSIDGDTFYQAVAVMEREDHRMILSRQWQAPDGKTHKEWSFRHDKIMEFFLVQPFLGHHPEAIEKRHNHIGDPRFRGIYLLLARLLPLDAALDLREALIHYAADTKDHTVSDSYVQIMRSRQDAPAALSFPYQYS